MDRIRIVGGNELAGNIPISGAKNAALPLMIASLLTDDTLTLENVPHLADVEQLIRILGNHGVDYSVNGRREKQQEGYSRTINFSARNIVDTTAPYELVSKMRASFWVVGPLLARMGEAKVSLPGGCAIGTRPVDLFIEGLQALGAEIDVENGYVITRAKNRLKGNRHGGPFFMTKRGQFRMSLDKADGCRARLDLRAPRIANGLVGDTSSLGLTFNSLQRCQGRDGDDDLGRRVLQVLLQQGRALSGHTKV